MKTNIEVNGYLIEVSEENGIVKVIATKDEEVVNEFTLEEAQEESQEESQDSDESQDADEFAQGEDDFGQSEVDETEADVEIEVKESKLMSFDEFCAKQ